MKNTAQNFYENHSSLELQRDVARPHLLRPQPHHPFDATAKYRHHNEQARNFTA
jgi:hypothetical protein